MGLGPQSTDPQKMDPSGDITHESPGRMGVVHFVHATISFLISSRWHWPHCLGSTRSWWIFSWRSPSLKSYWLGPVWPQPYAVFSSPRGTTEHLSSLIASFSCVEVDGHWTDAKPTVFFTKCQSLNRI